MVQVLGFRVQGGLGFRVQALGFRVLGFRILGFKRLGVQGLGLFRVSGGFRV